MIKKSGADEQRKSTIICRRAIVAHLMRQSGGPTPEPRDALLLAKVHYGLIPRQARVGRFTARICRLDSGEWAIDFNPDAPKLVLVAALWHELSELLCLSDDLVDFAEFATSSYQESATSSYDQRHLCAVGVERFVRYRLLQFPEVRQQLLRNKIRQILLARSSTASIEPVIPSIVREPWYEDEFEPPSMS